MVRQWLILLFLLPGLVLAGQPESQLSDEQRAYQLYNQLRCVVCEGQSLAESQAEIAVEMRKIIREQVAEGKSNQDILDYFTARYGEVIRQRPPVTPATYPLWLAPVALLLIGLICYRRFYS